MVNVKISRLCDWLLPSACILCGETSLFDNDADNDAMDLCTDCLNYLPANRTSCQRCAEPVQTETSSELTCGQCLRKTPRFDAATCAFRYAYPIDHLVRALKFHGRLAYGRVLGESLARHLQATRVAPWPEIIVPVPLAEPRFRERGFNQAIEIGSALERRLQIPLRADLVIRTRDTQEQLGLDSKARRKNVRKAFATLGKVEAKYIAIVDDVITTGSTMNELARTLKRAGVKRVEAWAVARTARPT